MKKYQSLFPVFFIMFIDNFGFALVFNLFGPILLNPGSGMLDPSLSQGMRNFLLGLLFALFPLAQFFGAPLIGDFADQFGRKRAFYISILGTAVGYLLSAIAISSQIFWLLFFSRLFTGFFAGNYSICLAAIADLSPNEQARARNYGYNTTILGMSWALAMIVTGYSSFGNLSIPFWITAALSLASLVVLWKCFQESFQGKEKIQVDLLKGIHNIAATTKIRGIPILFAIFLFWGLAWVTVFSWFSPVAIEQFHASELAITWYLVLLGVTWSLGSSLLNYFLLKQLSSEQLTLIGYGAAAVLMLLSAISTQVTYFGIFVGLAAIVAAFGLSNTLHLISMTASEKSQGKVMGLTNSAMALSQMMSGIVAGYLGKINPSLIFPACALFFAIGFILLFVRRLNYLSPKG